jgi:hypothetical protein
VLSTYEGWSFSRRRRRRQARQRGLKPMNAEEELEIEKELEAWVKRKKQKLI